MVSVLLNYCKINAMTKRSRKLTLIQRVRFIGCKIAQAVVSEGSFRATGLKVYRVMVLIELYNY